MKISGIEKVIMTPIPPHSTVIINGDTGVLKTTFAVEWVKSKLEDSLKKVCLFLNLKDETNFLIQHFQLQSFIEKKQMHIIDYDSLLEKISYQDLNSNLFDAIFITLDELQNIYGERLAFFILDPINLLFRNISNEKLRKNLYHFFSKISQYKMQSWLINEIEKDIQDCLYPCYFLSDGIINLGTLETHNDIIRYIQVQKMRGVNHSLDRFQITYKKNQLKILGSTYE